jgi:serine/tyrosine/threonine adenylyltransferase
VEWMRVGFVHGVMNTDNMSILGLTIDYGPYGWLDDFDPGWTPNTTDAGGRRYRYGQQPAVAQWNLMRLAEALVPVMGSEQPLQDGLDLYADVFTREYHAMLAAKLGLRDTGDATQQLAGQLHALLHAAEVDYTLFFRALGEVDVYAEAPADALQLLGDVFYDEAKRAAHADALRDWMARWQAASAAEGVAPHERRQRMHAVNPRYVLRNYLAQQVIDAAEAGDVAPLHELLDVMRRPYDDQPGRDRFAARRPEWARHKAGCSMLSCSS